MAIDNPPPESADEQAEAPGYLPSPPPPNKPPALPNKTIFVTGLSGAFLGAVAGFGACAGVVAGSTNLEKLASVVILLALLPVIGSVLGASGFVHLIKREARAAHRRAIARIEPAQQSRGPTTPITHQKFTGYSAMGGLLGFLSFLALFLLPLLLTSMKQKELFPVIFIFALLLLIGSVLGASGFIHSIKREARAVHRRAIARNEPAKEASGPYAPVAHHESFGYSAMGGLLGFFSFLVLCSLPLLLQDMFAPLFLSDDYLNWISIGAIGIVILFIAYKAGSTWRNTRAGRFHAKGSNADPEEMRTPRKTTTASSTGPAGCDSETRSAASDSPIG